MRARRAAWLIAFLVGACGVSAGAASAPTAAVAPAAEAGAAAPPTLDEPERGGQILVMLRMPPAHFRPDSDYAANYAARPERESLRRVAAGLASDFDLVVIDDWPMPALGVDCFVMRARDSDAGPIVDRLSRDRRVESAQPMHAFHTLAHAPSLYALQPAARAWHLDAMHRLATGRGVRVAIVDTGVDAGHPDLEGRVGVLRNFVDAEPTPAEAHGTAVAGIIAATGDADTGTVGIAPDAHLLALRACWERGAAAARCSSFTLAKALQFVIDEGAQVINLSLSGPSDTLLARLLDAAMARGATVVAAFDPRAADGGFPASLAGVVAVDTDARAGESRAAFLAPGRDIPAPLPGGRWGFVAGSSFAAAEVSGVVALLKELTPAMAPGALRNALAAQGATDSRLPERVDGYAAVERAARTCACVRRTATLAPVD